MPYRGSKVSFDVDKDHGLGVQAELCPGDNFHGLIERAGTTRQASKASDMSAMSVLRSCMVDDDVLGGETWMRALALDERAQDHPHHSPAGL